MVGESGRWKLRVVVVLVLATAAGCSRSFGLFRISDLATPPDLGCVNQVIASTPGVETVEVYDNSELSAGETERSSGDTSNAFQYFGADGSHIRGGVQISTYRNGRTRYRNYIASGTKQPMEEQINATRPIMMAIESRLIQTCGLAPSGDIVETCSKGVCG